LDVSAKNKKPLECLALNSILMLAKTEENKPFAQNGQMTKML
jgi:hypothetical protein